ncbi:MAG: helix-turn-helix domain-containing protein [Candidatus Parcubacteria bacterium]|nr:helix-turn-helix domain-containing protein [Candidatus Parcubacteria bacterium]
MKDETLGQVFKRYRESEGLKIAQVEKDIKISHRMIEALEADDYRALPDEIYVKNIIKTYGRYLSLDYNKLLALFDSVQVQKNSNLPEVKTKPIRVILTPQRVRNVIIGLAVLMLVVYLGWQLNNIFQPPQLSVYSPENNLATDKNYIEITGKTEKEARVYINEKEVFLDVNGEFKATLDLQKGMNLIKISAAKKRSKENVVYREILVQ